MPAWGGGGSLIAMPTTPIPQRLELGKQTLAAQNTNPFTGAQQTQAWGYNLRIGSCAMPPMSSTDGKAWQFFMDELDGVNNVFQFMTALCTDTRYCLALTSDGTTGGTPKYFRLTGNTYKVSISEGGIFNLTFEFREAL